jgi:thiol-disulfide isomerase/thioredoxin
VTGGLIVLVIVLGGALAGGLTWRRRNGTMRAPGPASAREPTARELTAREHAITSAELGVPLGPKATLVQFSTAFCAPCRATGRVLAEVAGMTTGVTHVEIDAESRMDLVRSLDVRRTPTVLVLGPDGRIAKRASGQPRKADVIAALGEVI